jgi:hypothetical protein
VTNAATDGGCVLDCRSKLPTGDDEVIGRQMLLRANSSLITFKKFK